MPSACTADPPDIQWAAWTNLSPPWITRPPPGPRLRAILRLLWPFSPLIAVGLGLLLASIPCDLFPAFIWKYVADDLASNRPSSPWLRNLVSLWNTVHGKYHLLAIALVWLFGVYILGAAMAAIETNLLNRVAQKFILGLRNSRVSQAPDARAWAISSASAPAT